MRNITLEQQALLATIEELPADVRQLVERAKEATNNAYAPYSQFHVGAAVRLASGVVVIGANQENAAYPVTVCAERAAIFAASSEHPTQAVTHVAIAARNAEGFPRQPIAPCGSCRQVMLELEQRHNNKITIYLYGTDGVYIINGAETLLPLSFTDKSMM